MYTLYFLGFVGFEDTEVCEPGGTRKGDPQKRLSYLCHAVTLGVLIVIFIATTFIGVREQKSNCSVIVGLT